MTSSPPRVFVVDDDPSVRMALARLIGAAGHTVETFGSAREFLDKHCHMEAGCLVLDLRMPDLDGLELLDILRNAGSVMPVVFMTGFGDIPTSVRAMKAGAVDFLPKPVADEALLQAIGAALEADGRARHARSGQEDVRRRFEGLTPREREVFRLVVAGRLNKQVARELGVAEKTVKVHRARVMEKMGVRRVAQLVQLAVRLDLDSEPSASPELALREAPTPSAPGLWPRSPLTLPREASGTPRHAEL